MLNVFFKTYGLKLLAFAAVAMAVLVFGQQATINHQREVNAEQALAIQGLTRQVNADRVTIQELGTVARRDRVIYVRTQNAIESINSAVGADTLVPPDVASTWAAGIASLRNEAADAPFSDQPYRDAGTVVSTANSA